MTNLEIVEAVLKLYDKHYRVAKAFDTIVVEDKLCRKFFKTLNERIEGLDFWYYIHPSSYNCLIIEIHKGKQI